MFSSLYSMLPQSKTYLLHGGFSPKAAAYMLIGLFLAGVIGIQILSSFLHRHLPSHVVDCDHNHDEEAGLKHDEEMDDEPLESDNAHPPTMGYGPPMAEDIESFQHGNENTPLLALPDGLNVSKQRTSSAPETTSGKPPTENGFVTAPSSRKPSLLPRGLTRSFARLVRPETKCDENGPCMGYSDPCGGECFKVLQKRGGLLPPSSDALSRSASLRQLNQPALDAESPEYRQRSQSHADLPSSRADSRSATRIPQSRSRSSTHHYHHANHERGPVRKQQGQEYATDSTHSGKAEHHHHVPTNAFLSIGLQTSLAIALHKAPEGFITYATNHVNPTLGFSVFMALLIHNITEGFAMSLPLYLALGSRVQAIVWSSVLGGISQPLGAGIAELWFRVAAHRGGRGAGEGPSEAVYGGMFAVTAGIMTSVALNLFSESLQLSHNRATCITFAFLGMAILGLTSALTA